MRRCKKVKGALARKYGNSKRNKKGRKRIRTTLTSAMFIQVNLHHSSAAANVFDEHFKNGKFTFGLIQEPYTASKHTVKQIHNGMVVSLNDSVNSPRAALVIKRGIKVLELKQFTHRDLVAVRVLIKQGKSRQVVVVASGYHDSTKAAVPEELENLVKFCKDFNYQLIYGCDANAHNSVWGGVLSDKRGENLLKYIISKDLQILNVGDTQTFYTTRSKRTGTEIIGSWIDLTITSVEISHRVEKWKVSTVPNCSDHRYIEFGVEKFKLEEGKYRNPKNTDWCKFRARLKASLPELKLDISSIADFEAQVNLFTDIIKRCYEDSNKEKTPGHYKKNVWWNSSLDKAKGDAKAAQETAEISKHSKDAEVYRNKVAEYKKLIDLAKLEAWNKLIEEELKDLSITGKMYKILSKGRRPCVGTIVKEDGNYTTSELETLLCLAESHFPNLVICRDNPNCQFDSLQLDIDTNESEAIFSMDAIEWATKTFKPYKSPGADLIFPAMLQKCLDLFLPVLQKFFILSHAWNHIPEAWCKVNVIYIPKAGRIGSNDPKSFRPVSLTSFCLKTMERIKELKIRMDLTNNPLHCDQFAYQAGKSTVDALQSLVSKIYKAFAYEEFSLVTIFDIAGAFDNTPHDVIGKILEKRGVDRKTTNWIKSMLSKRKIKTSLGNSSITFKVEKGCPQGGVLSPLMWCLVMDELLIILNNEGFVVQAYADDLVIMVQGKDSGTIQNRMQRALRLVESWCWENGLSANPDKTELVLFTRKRNYLEKDFIVKFYNKNLEVKKMAKYLGVILDRKLLWKEHIQYVTDKAKKRLFTCKTIVRKTWGLRPCMVRWIYTAIVRPTIDYACLIWWMRTKVKWVIKKLKSIQHLACLLITGCMANTSTAAMEKILNLPPLHLYIQSVAAKSNHKNVVSGTKQARRLIDKELTNKSNIMENLRINISDRCISKVMWKKNFKTSFPSRSRWKNKKVFFREKSIICYTDGSRTEKGTGYGVFIAEDGTEIVCSLGSKATIFQAEVLGINACVLELLSKGISQKTIYICSDSHAALKALNQSKINSKIVAETIKNLNELGRKNTVVLRWVPAHNGIEGNELADELAKQGANNKLIGPEPFTGLSWALPVAGLSSILQRDWNEYWNNLPGHQHAKKFVGTDSSRYKDLIKLNRKDLSKTVGFLSGSYPVKAKLKLWKKVQDDTCRFCRSDEETIKHLLCDCACLESKRMRILGRDYPAPREYCKMDPDKIVNYIKSIKIFDESKN